MLALATALLIAGCAVAGFDCSRSLCGCASAEVLSVTVKLTDADGNTIPDANLICHDDSKYLGSTNPNGLATFSVMGSGTPGCGFIPDCRVAYVRNKDGGFGRLFWFARFIRGEDAFEGDERLELIDDGRKALD